MKIYFWILMILFTTGLSVAAQTKTPDQRVTDYFKAFNSGNEKVMRDFFNENFTPESLGQRSADQQLEFYRRIHGEMESVEIKQMMAKSSTEMTALAQTKRGDWVNFVFSFEPRPPQKIDRMRIERTEAPTKSGADQTPLTEAEFLAVIDNYLSAIVKADEFSGAVLIAKNEKPLYKKAFGLANKDSHVANRFDTKFNLGSINKIFTQIAVGQLVKQGKLSFDDKLGKYLPDYPNQEAADKITIRHLLTMTSGVGDLFGEKYDATPKKNLRKINDFIELFSDKPLAFEPGTKNQYSNGGYILLGAIIEKASGKNYYDYMRENIFKPLGMTNTEFYESDQPISNMAEGYTKNGAKLDQKAVRQNNFETRSARGSSAGGGYSTVEDLLKFSLALQNGKVSLPDQKVFNGVGVMGGAPGINAALEIMPQTGFTIIVMSNYDPPSAEKVSKRLREFLSRVKNK